MTKGNLVEVEDSAQLSLDSKDREVSVELLQEGDFVKVYPGSGVPLDGVVVLGSGICNESMLTGESRPVSKEPGTTVFGGTILLQGNIIMKVEKTAENSSVNQIIQLVENAQNNKAPIQGYADKISKYFVPSIILIAILTWIFWFAYAFSALGI